MKQSIPDIAQCVEQNLQQNLKDLNGTEPSAEYDMVMHQVEKPMLECVIELCGGNQSKAAVILGLNRNTLRKKLLQHGLLSIAGYCCDRAQHWRLQQVCH